MYRLLPFLIILTGAMQEDSHGQDWVSPFDNQPTRRPAVTSAFANWSPLIEPLEDGPNFLDHGLHGFAWQDSPRQRLQSLSPVAPKHKG